MRWHPLLVLAVAGATVAVSGCGKDEDNTSTAPGMGTVRVSMTDAPAAVEAVNLVVREVSVHQTATSDVQGWYTIHADTDTTIDLVTLQNGRTIMLGAQQVPSGSYDQVRLKLGTGSTVTVDGTVNPLTVPSGAQSGLEIRQPFTVPSGGTVDLAIDVDAARSIHQTGNGTWMMNPVVRVVVVTQTGAIAGQLSPAADATIYATTGADTVSSALAISDGRFKLAFLPTGNYAVHINAASGYRDTILSNVIVAHGDTTQLGTITLAPERPQQ